MKAGKTEIIFIMDKSGSMVPKTDDAIGSMNSFIEEQKQLPGECIFTYTEFNTVATVVLDGVPIKDVKPLTRETYRAYGNTALLDAVGNTIKTVGRRLQKTPESDRPEHVVIVVMTDGEENSSHHYSYDDVGKMITHQTEKYNWKFIFLGQNLNAQEVSDQLGTNYSSSNLCFISNPISGGTGVAKGMAAARYAVREVRTSGNIDKAGTSAILNDPSDLNKNTP